MANAARQGMALAALLMAAVLFVRAGQENAQDVLDNVKKKYEAINDAELTFTQKVKFSLSKAEQSTSGTLLLKKPNKYRIETGDQTIVTDGSTVWSYSPATNQVLIDNFKQDDRSLTPEKLLTGAPGGFDPTFIGKDRLGKGEVVQLKLTPRDEQSLITSVRLWVDESDWMIRQVEIVDANGKQTTYSVQHSRVNAGVPDSRFEFHAPQGTEAVDLR